MSEQLNKLCVNIPQNFSEAEKAQARANIGVEALPSKTGNAGKVLAVNSQATGLEWVAGGGGSQVQLFHHYQQVSITAGQYVTPETYNLNAYIPANSKFYGTLTIERLSNVETAGAYHFNLYVPGNEMVCNFGDYPSARQSGHTISFTVDNSSGKSQYQLYFKLSGAFEAQNLTVHVDGIVFN